MSETIATVSVENYVGGEWRPAHSGETYEKRNPMRPEEVLNEEELEELRRSGEALYCDGSKTPEATPSDPWRLAAEEN